MKNIHVLLANKPSSLYFSGNNSELLFLKGHIFYRAFGISPQNIYITSDEETKDGDWVLDKFNQRWKLEDKKLIGFDSQGIKIFSTDNVLGHECKKIILTTDQDLIKDGVQAIDDEFLEWFVKNPSCEYVKVTEHLDAGFSYGYKIIFPKEEPELQCKDCNDNLTDCTCIEDTVDMKQTPGKETADYIDRHIVEAMVEVAKQNLYSEVFQWLASRDYLSDKVDIIQKEFEQFKKK